MNFIYFTLDISVVGGLNTCLVRLALLHTIFFFDKNLCECKPSASMQEIKYKHYLFPHQSI